MRKYKSLAFDLDDTLLDTSGLLVPQAARRACEALQKAGVPCELEDCLNLRRTMAAEFSHNEIFTRIAQQYGAANKDLAVQGALEAFYNPEVPTSLPLLPGSAENLDALGSSYKLFLVTMGSYDTQIRKIKALNIEHHFQKIYVLNSFTGERKEQAFQDILRLQNHEPQKLLSIGNRLSSEIRDGKRVGADTCYFAFGEHLGEKPQVPEDHPDYVISHHRDLIATCGL